MRQLNLQIQSGSFPGAGGVTSPRAPTSPRALDGYSDGNYAAYEGGPYEGGPYEGVPYEGGPYEGGYDEAAYGGYYDPNYAEQGGYYDNGYS